MSNVHNKNEYVILYNGIKLQEADNVNHPQSFMQ